MKTFKRITALLMCLLMFASVCVVSNAVDESVPEAESEAVVEETTVRMGLLSRLFKRNNTSQPVTEVETQAPEQTEKANSKAKAQPATQAQTAAPETKKTSTLGSKRQKVANMYLFVSEANPKMPHVWIYIENLTDNSYTVGHYPLGPHQTMSAGCWKDRGNGYGIYYNLERYWVKDATYGRSVCLKTQLTERQLNRVSKAFNRHNYWNWVFNCTWFGVGIWNSSGTLKLVAYMFSPKILKVNMKMFGAKAPNFTIQKLTNASQVYKHTSSGIETVVSGALYTSTGV